jgi:hypothetical protein
MKDSSLVIVALLAVGLAACQRQAGPARSADARPTPSPLAAAESSPSAATGDSRIDPATGVRIETAPAPGQRPRQGSTTRPPVATDTRLPAPQRGPESEPLRPADGVATTVRRAEEPLVLPEGSELPIRLRQMLASDKSRAEEAVAAELTEDVRASGRVALPAGTEVLGHVVVAQQSGRVKGRARLVVAFDEVRLRNRSYPIEARRWDVTAESSRSRDTKIAGGATAAGAIIGAITGGGSGALKGGLIGGAAGGAAVLVTRGKEVELPSGARHKVTLRQALRVE